MTAVGLPTVPPVLPGAFLTVNWSGIPRELHDLARWALWRAVPQPAGSGGPKKLPLRCNGGGTASSTDPRTWGGFGDAWFGYRATKSTGIMLALGDGLAAIDLDDCRDRETGIVGPWAAAVVARFDSFCEVSPSGTGLHVLIRGRLSKGVNAAIDGHRIEMYSDRRFLCMTGWAVQL